MERNFLIVAADGKVREALAGELRDKGFTVTLAENGAEAERVVRSVSVTCVLIESHLKDMAPDELRNRIKQTRPDCDVVVVTSFKLVRNTPELLSFGADDYLMRGNQVFDLLRSPYESSELATWPWEERGSDALIQVIDVLVGLLEMEYKLFSSSSHQAMRLAKDTATELGAHEEMVNEVVLGTLLRDVGKASLDPASLIHVESLSEEQHGSIKEHVNASIRMFEHIDFAWKVLPVVRHHHERYNGTGSPDGLRGREIPMGSRIVAAVDAYVAMTTGQDSTPLTPDEALAELVRRAGHQFDPEVVEAFHRVIDKRLAGRRKKGKPVVVLMEPDKEFRKLVKMRLLNEGLEVVETKNYEKTLERMLKTPPALVLLNVDVESSEAFQLLQEMQSDDKLVRIPVAFVTHRVDRVTKLRALRQGIDDFLCKSDDLEEIVARVENILSRTAMRAEGEVRTRRRGITGSLENLSLADIIQTLTIGMKTACLSLSADGNEGKIWFENGAPMHAETKELQSEEAFYEMVRWKDGEFVIEHGVKTETNSLDHDAMYLLMEGLRQLDESADDSIDQAAS